MIRVSVEVCSGSGSFRAAVWAESIEQALTLTKACYQGGEAAVVFPIEPEAFFVRGIVPPSGMVHPEMPEGQPGGKSLGPNDVAARIEPRVPL
jgi:hypothetical protein